MNALNVTLSNTVDELNDIIAVGWVWAIPNSSYLFILKKEVLDISLSVTDGFCQILHILISRCFWRMVKYVICMYT